MLFPSLLILNNCTICAQDKQYHYRRDTGLREINVLEDIILIKMCFRFHFILEWNLGDISTNLSTFKYQ